MGILYLTFFSTEVFSHVTVFQVDLLKEMFVSGVATQGSKFYDCWVSSYKLLFRGLGPVWKNYSEADIEQVRRVNEIVEGLLNLFLWYDESLNYNACFLRQQIQIIERKMLQYLGPGVLDKNSPTSVTFPSLVTYGPSCYL